MKVHFKGTRGSLPISLTAGEVEDKVISALLAARGKDLRSEGQIREFVEKTLKFRTSSSWGGNTSCVHIDTGSNDYMIMDGGSGLRALGKEIIESSLTGLTFHIFLSHLHYDHIQGIPFCPAYFPSNSVVFHGGHRDIEKFCRQMEEPFFPLTLTPWEQTFLSKNIVQVMWSKYAMQKSPFLNKTIPVIPTATGWRQIIKLWCTRLTVSIRTTLMGKITPTLTLSAMQTCLFLMLHTLIVSQLETVSTGVIRQCDGGRIGRPC